MSEIGSTLAVGMATSQTPLLTSSESHAEMEYGSRQNDTAFSSTMRPPKELRRVADSLPSSVWLIAIVEFCERFAFFGILAPMQNYIQNQRNDPTRPGGLGIGQAHATFVNQSFLLWCFVTPLVGAAVADQYLGRVKTIAYSSMLYLFGLVILVASSLPASHDIGISFLGLILALFLIGIGTGGIKANMSSLIAEQYVGPREAICTLKSGENVIVDKRLTTQRIFTTYFVYINLGGFSTILTTKIEQQYGFSAAFSLPTAVFVTGVATILATQHRYIHSQPTRSLLLNSFHVVWIALWNGDSLHHARPSNQDQHDHAPSFPWDDEFIDDLTKVFKACKLFLLYPLYWAAYSQSLTNFISQGGTMETHGIPNDAMVNINPITVLIMLLVLDQVVYPFLRRLGLSVRLLDRTMVGFVTCGIAMLYAAYLQSKIYTAPPCYSHPRALNCKGGRVPNQVSIFLQTPAYVLVALSEVLAPVAGVEYAYTKAPKSMKSLVMAINLSTVSVGSLLALFVSPLAKDPSLVVSYIVLGFGCFLASAGLCLLPL